jgi:Uncharacterised nucleotidyltransferase
MTGLPPEFELLLDCCAQRFREGLRKQTQNVAPQRYDWKRFISLAEYHGVIPLVYGSLAPESARLPLQDFALLRSKYEENVRKALWFTSELVRILEHLEAHGIKAIPYKGPPLAQILYGDVTARQFSDLDILVCPEDLGAAKDALATLGYVPGIRLKARQERAYIFGGYEYPFDNAAGPHLIELQWRILPHFYAVNFDTAGFFTRAPQVTLAGRSFPTLSLDDLLLVLCVHAAKHVWARLSWLCDIVELARSARIDWGAVWPLSGELGIQRIVALNFLLGHDLLGLALPIPIQRWLKKDDASRILKVELLQTITRSLHHDTESLAYFRLMIRLRERRWDRARFMSRLICTPGIGEWSAMHLPEGLSSVYHFVRLGRLAKKMINRCDGPPPCDAHESGALSSGNGPRTPVQRGLTVDETLPLQ